MIKNIYFGVILKKTGHLNNENKKYFERVYIVLTNTRCVYTET